MVDKEHKELKKVFLSAGVPEVSKDSKYIATADLIAVRDAIRSLAVVLASKATVIYGGHPAITRLVHEAMAAFAPVISENIILYQSRFHKQDFPEENGHFVNKVYTEEKKTRAESLRFMREKMIRDHDYHAGVFIGGMDGVEEEFGIFREVHPQAITMPVASTGGAAKFIYEDEKDKFDKRLASDLGYMGLFRDFLKL